MGGDHIETSLITCNFLCLFFETFILALGPLSGRMGLCKGVQWSEVSNLICWYIGFVFFGYPLTYLHVELLNCV
jgi:hypothetical protein